MYHSLQYVRILVEMVVPMTKKAVAIENNLSDISLPSSAMLIAAVVDEALAIFAKLKRKDLRELKITRELMYMEAKN